MVPPVDLRKVFGSKFHAKAIHIISGAECNRLYDSQKKVKMVEGVVINVELQITKQRRNKLYAISDYKILIEVSIGKGYILSLWLQYHF